MPYTVIQIDNAAISEQQLAAALPVTGRFAPADAVKIARESFGFFVERLDYDQAKSLQAAMRKQGVETEMIKDEDLFTMPPVKTTKRIDCLPEHLLVHDSLGRPKAIPWGQVLVVAAGLVSLFETEIVEHTTRAPQSNTAVVLSSVAIVGLAGTGMRPKPPLATTTRSLKGAEVPRYVLDVVVLGDPSRYRAEAQELSYAYLGQRQTGDPAGNFAVMLGDLVTFATSAALNQGSIALMSDCENAFTYPSRKAFEREIVWLVWRGSRP